MLLLITCRTRSFPVFSGREGPMPARAAGGTAPERMACAQGPFHEYGRQAPERRRQTLAHLLPKAGFSRPMTLTVLPHRFTGMWTGTWTTLPERTPGELVAAAPAPASARA